jgi:3-phosphoshikimate 1-carboxyvinyltransferase|tara:strand:- start:439 stop:1656 length:1218 start_codon:yes stop_codon:yes gene_type:complete
MNSIEKITVSASKSYLQRALAIAALSEGISVLNEVSWCNDSIAAKNIIENLGCKIEENNRILLINQQNISFNYREFNANEAGLSIRMFSPIFALSNHEINFKGEGSLNNRPIQLIADALFQLGVIIQSNNGLLPIKIKGPIKSGVINIDGSLSSQLLTGLLIALPLVKGDSVINVHNLKSIPYIDMTVKIMEHFGVKVDNIDYKTFKIKGNQKYQATTYNIEGDWSGGAFFLVYGAVKGAIEITNLSISSNQADKVIINALKLAGAKIIINKESLIVEQNKLHAFYFDATNCPDLFPPLVCLASQCKGITEIKGISRLTHKESDRADVLKKEFIKMGIYITFKNDSMYITGNKPQPCTIDSHNDHRIAMAGGIMNLFCDGEIKIENKEAINKSYPDFFEQLRIFQ